MKLPVYFVFSPSATLCEASSIVEHSWLAEVSVWTTHETDRLGLEHSRDELQEAFWAHFCAQLICENETEAQRSFRVRCLQLGFSGCWNVTETKGGGSAEDLLDSGREAVAFLESRSDTLA